MKTPTNTARDLLLLAVIAHSNKKYDTAGSLFSAAMASADIEDVVNTLQTMTDEPGVSTSSSLSFAPHQDSSMSLSAIASVLAAAMEDEDELQDEDEEADLGAEDGTPDTDGEEEEEDASEEEEEDDDSPVDGDDSTDDMDPDSPGDTLMPSSISSAVKNDPAQSVKRNRPSVAADETDNESTASADQSFTAVLPAGRSPVTIRT